MKDLTYVKPFVIIIAHIFERTVNMFKTKKIKIFTAISVIIILAIIVISGYIPNANASTPEPTQMELTLIGDEEITITLGDKYVEPGYIATNEIGEDLNSNVVIHSTVDTEHVGKYIVVYILEDIVKTRSVVVEENITYLEPEFHYAEAKTTADFSNDITLDYAYIQPDKLMPFGLITPSTAKTSEKIPLIISLHGQSERGCNEKTFKSKFVINLMRNWEMQGFNAYVMFPHLTGDFYSESWNSNQTAEQFFDMLDWFIAHYNVDPDRIIIQGQSMGGYGCLFMAAYHPEYFAGCVPISPYNSNVDLNKIASMPVRCYVGHSRFGEDSRSAEFATGKLQSFIGEENVNQREVSHNEIPIIAYTEDFDTDNIPDLLEWMFDQKRAVIFE
jgi:hypothetical protein